MKNTFESWRGYKSKVHAWDYMFEIYYVNSDLEEEVYMKQPRGFFSSDGEHLVYKLKKSIYGLK